MKPLGAAIVIGLAATAGLACGAAKTDDTQLLSRTCDQACEDGAVIFATWLSVDNGLYNSEVVNHSLPRSGVACPGGGTVDLSGTATNSGGTNTLDLTYVLSSCRFTENGYDLTYTGTLVETGQFNNATKLMNLLYMSTGLTWSGTVGYGSSPFPTTGNACAVSISRLPALSGSLCGRQRTSGTTPP